MVCVFTNQLSVVSRGHDKGLDSVQKILFPYLIKSNSLEYFTVKLLFVFPNTSSVKL